MANIEAFLSRVELEVGVAALSGIFPPDPEGARPALERLSRKFPELDIKPDREQKILLHARLYLNAENN